MHIFNVILDPLEDEGSLKEQMDRLPVIARLQYDTVAQYLLSVFEQALTSYDQGINLAANLSPTREVRQQLLILEGRMTWLTYMVASVIGNVVCLNRIFRIENLFYVTAEL
jgi:exportin-7